MRRAVIPAVVLLLALAGCGGDPKADPSSSPSSPSTSPVSTAPSAPVMPEEAKADTKAGARAFVKYYIELINQAQATGDVDALATAEDPGCRSCANARQTLNSIYGTGGHIEGGEFTASISEVTRRPEMNEWTVFAAVKFAPQQVVRSDGTTSLKGGRSVMTLVVSYVGSNWLVKQWTRGS
jgi:hypothetical protein